MSRYPFPNQQQQSLHQHDRPFSPQHYQEGHSHHEAADWSHPRSNNTMKQTTDSVSSFQSWTSSSDQPYHSNTSSYSQHPHHPPQPHQLQHQTSYGSLHNQFQGQGQGQPSFQGQAHRQSPMMQPHQQPPPRGQSLSSNNGSVVGGGTAPIHAHFSGGRYRSSSNSSNVSGNNNAPLYHHQNHTQQQQQQQQQAFGRSPPQHSYAQSTGTINNSDHYNQTGSHQSLSSQHSAYSQQEPPLNPSQQLQQHYSQQLQQLQQHQLQQQLQEQQQQQQQQQQQKQSEERPTSADAASKDGHDSMGFKQQTFAPAQSPPHLFEQQQVPPPMVDSFIERRNESPRSSQRAQRRRDPAPEEAPLPSLDDYEAMLQEMTSPSMGPRGRRGATRRPEREQRAERTDRSRPTKKQDETKQQQGQRQSETQSSSQDLLNEEEEKAIQAEADRLFAEKRLKRRSSLPSKLKESPNLFSNLQRRNSGQDRASPKPVTETPKLRTLVEYTTMSDAVSVPRPAQGQDRPQDPASLQDYSHLPALQPKRFSWEDESVQPRIDLLPSSSMANENPVSSAQRKSSWQDLEEETENQGRPEHQQQQQEAEEQNTQPRTSQQYLGLKPPAKSKLRLSQTVSQPNIGEIITLIPILDDEQDQKAPETEGLTYLLPGDSVAPARPQTPASRSRPATPIGNIKPPSGPAPHGANVVATSPLVSRKNPANSGAATGKRAGGHKSNGSSSSISSKDLLLPFTQGGARPRASSGASVSSMNSFTFDRMATPPPPSSPLPSLPPPSPPLSHRKISEERDLALPASHLVLDPSHHVHAMSLPTPSSSLPMSPELSHVDERRTSTQMAQLKKKISHLERELASTEIALSSRIRDESELRSQLDHLSVERNSLAIKLAYASSALEETRTAKAVATETSFPSGFERSDTSLPLDRSSLDRASLQMMHDQELKDAVRQIQDEKEVLFEALMDRQDRSRTEMVAQLEQLQKQMEAKELELEQVRQERDHHQEQGQIQSARPSEDIHGVQQVMEDEMSRLNGLQKSLEFELNLAKEEVQRLEQAAVDKEQAFQSEESLLRDEHASKMEALTAQSQDLEAKFRKAEQAAAELEELVATLRSEQSLQEERCEQLARELEASREKSEQEEAQYRILQDTVQRLSTKVSALESEHATEVQRMQQEHGDVLERTVQDHADRLSDLSERHRFESEADLLNHTDRLEDAFAAERRELDARERVLRDRIENQSDRQDQLEEELFQMQKRLDASEKEKAILERTNRSLERHVSMQHLQEQENVFKMENLEQDVTRLNAILAGLNVAAAEASTADDEQESKSDEASTPAALFEEQRRRWVEQAELMARRAARAEEEARKVMEMNIDLRVALDLTKNNNNNNNNNYSGNDASNINSRRDSTFSTATRESFKRDSRPYSSRYSYSSSIEGRSDNGSRPTTPTLQMDMKDNSPDARVLTPPLSA